MRNFLVLLPVAVFLLLGSVAVFAQDAPKCTETNGLKAYEIKDILKAHKSARDSAKATPLAWDCSLAAKAQALAAGAAGGSASTPAAGESRLSSHDASLDVNLALDTWRQEKSDWDSKTGACENGRVCSHWEQMTAPATTKIGCGIDRSGKGTSKAVLVCLYDPPRP
jgi:hypothetical protein